jgi:hypothetical protein
MAELGSGLFLGDALKDSLDVARLFSVTAGTNDFVYNVADARVLPTLKRH